MSERVQCVITAANAASRRVAEKVGFELEGELPWFVAQPTPEMVENGAVTDPRTLMVGLVRHDRDRLAWFQPLISKLELWDWEGRKL